MKIFLPKLFVMPSASFDYDCVAFNVVNQAIGIVNAPRPAVKIMELFGLADTFVDAVEFDVFKQIVNALERLTVLPLPINVMRPAGVRPQFVYL